MMEYLMQIFLPKEIMDGGNFNLNAGASFPIFEKTFTGDLILDENGRTYL